MCHARSGRIASLARRHVTDRAMFFRPFDQRPPGADCATSTDGGTDATADAETDATSDASSDGGDGG